jgi:glycosyltransferase involved in cell wall biosynthesis
MTSKPKVLWICSWYPNRTMPTFANFVYRHAKATSLYADIAVIYACSDVSVKKGYEVVLAYEPFLTVRIYYAATQNPFTKIWRIIHAYKMGYKRLVSEGGKPDLIHLNVLYPAGIFGWYLHWQEKIPFVLTEHRGGYLHKQGSYKGLFMKLFTKLTVQKASAVLALSTYFASAMKSHGLINRNYAIIPNVVDTTVFTITSDIIHTSSAFKFLHVSMFDDDIKNISGILRCVANFAQRRSDFVLNIIGDGNDRQKLLDLANELNILNRFVFFQGTKSHEEVAAVMREDTDTFVLFSNMESQSCVILEAMACGLPIIATETGGINERVTEQTGILLDIGDEKGLVEAMNYMIDNRGKYDPSVIRQKIVEKCSVEAVGQAIADVYQTVLFNKTH